MRRQQLIEATIEYWPAAAMPRPPWRTSPRPPGCPAGLSISTSKARRSCWSRPCGRSPQNIAPTWRSALAMAGDSPAERLEAILSADSTTWSAPRASLPPGAPSGPRPRAARPISNIAAPMTRNIRRPSPASSSEIIAEGGYPYDAARIARGLEAMMEGIWLDMMTMQSPITREEGVKTVYRQPRRLLPAAFHGGRRESAAHERRGRRRWRLCPTPCPPPPSKWARRVRAFVVAELVPYEEHAELNQGRLPDGVAQRHQRLALELGLSRIDVPRRFGGLAFPCSPRSPSPRRSGQVTNALSWCFPEAPAWMFDAFDAGQIDRYALPMMRRPAPHLLRDHRGGGRLRSLRHRHHRHPRGRFLCRFRHEMARYELQFGPFGDRSGAARQRPPCRRPQPVLLPDRCAGPHRQSARPPMPTPTTTITR